MASFKSVPVLSVPAAKGLVRRACSKSKSSVTKVNDVTLDTFI